MNFQPLKIQIWHSEDHTSWYILIIKANEMHYICLIQYSTCFGQVHCPSSGVSQHCTHTIGICHASSDCCLLAWSEWNWCSILTTLADANRTSITNTYCVCTVLRYSWWWTVDLSETCGVLYQINLRNSASRWLLL